MFDNDYPNRKDNRKKYYKRGKHDRSCRPNGGCPYCKDSRLHKTTKRIKFADLDIKEFEEN